jgi:AraC family transcriptional regulator, melibiose operon regulatory protein
MTLRRKAPFGVAEDRFSADRREMVLPMAKPHTHNQIEINYLNAGAVTYLYNGRLVEVVENDFVFFWGAIPHQALAAKPQSHFVCIYVPLEMFMFSAFSPELKSTILGGGFVKILEHLPMDDALLRQIRFDLQTNDPQLSELNFRHLELRLRRGDIKGWTDLLDVSPAHTSTPGNTHRKIVDMTRYISERSDSSLTVTEIADAVSLHPKYAMTLFHRSLGMTITQYVTRRRLVTAQRLLVSSEKNAAAIAYESGFGSVSRFYAAFRDQIGMSPREFKDIYGRRGATSCS